MHVHMAETLQTAISTIYHWADALDEKRVKRSASPKWLTSALSWLTGLADENDAKTIEDGIHKLQTMVGKAAQTFAQSETHIGQLMKLTNERINTLQSLINRNDTRKFEYRLQETHGRDDSRPKCTLTAGENSESDTTICQHAGWLRLRHWDRLYKH
jgi:hypothetical protein